MNGLLDLPWWATLLIALAMTHITIAAVTIYLHRHQAHRALTLHPAVALFFRFWLWLTTGMRTAEWVAVHRKHHASCETEQDPHSPQTRGINTVLWQGAELYRVGADNGEILARYSHGTPNDWWERKLFRFNIGIVLMLFINVILFGALGLTVWAIQMAWIPFFAAGIINGLGHWWGYRNFESDDASTNLSPWGILIGGEELHNNHHAFAASAKLSNKPWEFDIGWLYIRVLAALGLATVRCVAPQPTQIPGKLAVDIDTVKAVFASRLQVMAQYRRQVTRVVYAREMRDADAVCRNALKSVSRYLNWAETRLNREKREQLAVALAKNETMETVVMFRRRLADLWSRRVENQEKLREALAEWCHEAEATGITALKEFSAYLRSYTLVGAAA